MQYVTEGEAINAAWGEFEPRLTVDRTESYLADYGRRRVLGVLFSDGSRAELDGSNQDRELTAAQLAALRAWRAPNFSVKSPGLHRPF